MKLGQHMHTQMAQNYVSIDNLTSLQLTQKYHNIRSTQEDFSVCSIGSELESCM